MQTLCRQSSFLFVVGQELTASGTIAVAVLLALDRPILRVDSVSGQSQGVSLRQVELHQRSGISAYSDPQRRERLTPKKESFSIVQEGQLHVLRGEGGAGTCLLERQSYSRCKLPCHVRRRWRRSRRVRRWNCHRRGKPVSLIEGGDLGRW